MERTVLTLQPSEQAILAAASRLYAAYVVSGQVAEGQEDGWRARCVREAISIAREVDERIVADDEIRS
jgi:hypothetical protein